jgi:CAAX prenyl protease-like protein
VFIAVQPLAAGWVDTRWVAVARGVAVAALLAALWPRYTELRDGPAVAAREWGLALAAGFAVFVVWIVFDSGWAAVGGGQGFVPLRADGSLDLPLVVLRLLGMALVVPVMEELFWRSFLMRWIDRREFLEADPRQASTLAVVVTAVLFASEHTQWFAGLVAGFVYNGLYRRTGNLRVPIASHAATNALLGAWILATHDWRFW